MMGKEKSAFWRTAISKVEPNKILVRGYDLAALLGEYSLGEIVHLVWQGELPTVEIGKLVETMLAASCEHGLSAPSTDATRFVASCGVPLESAVAAGICALGDLHGGAIERCGKVLVDGVKTIREEGKGVQEVADMITNRHKEKKERLVGYGHPTHTDDPRTRKILQMAEEVGVSKIHVRLAKAIEATTERYYGKTLILNIDGAIAAVSMDMGFDWRVGKGFFIVGRAIGLVAHALEQMSNEGPYKSANWQEVEYLGTPPRDVPRRTSKDNTM